MNESGVVKYKEIVDPDVKLKLEEALSAVKRSILFKEIKGEANKAQVPLSETSLFPNWSRC